MCVVRYYRTRWLRNEYNPARTGWYVVHPTGLKAGPFAREREARRIARTIARLGGEGETKL